MIFSVPWKNNTSFRVLQLIPDCLTVTETEQGWNLIQWLHRALCSGYCSALKFMLLPGKADKEIDSTTKRTTRGASTQWDCPVTVLPG